MEAKTIESLAAEIQALRSKFEKHTAELADMASDLQNLMRHVLFSETTPRRRSHQKSYQKTPEYKAKIKANAQKRKEELDKLADEHREARLAASRILNLPPYRDFAARKDAERQATVNDSFTDQVQRAKEQLARETESTTPPTQDNNQ